jgi:hypothetical protein
MIARVLRAPTPPTAEHEQVDAEWSAIVAAMAKDRARRMRWEAAGTILLACFFLLFVAVAAALRLL